MKDFLRNANVWPQRTPRLNTRHPLYTVRNCCFAGIANNGGFTDLQTGITMPANTSTASGVDENGPYIWNTAGTSAGALSFTGGTSANFTNMGVIFKRVSNSGNRQYLFTIDTNTGFWMNGNNFTFLISNGTILSIPITVGHTYYAVMTDGPATSGFARMVFLYDMTTSLVMSVRGSTVAGNITTTPIGLLQASSGQVSDRVYAAFAGGSPGSPFNPPWYQIPPIFYSVPEVLDTLQNPWSLWYA